MQRENIIGLDDYNGFRANSIVRKESPSAYVRLEKYNPETGVAESEVCVGCTAAELEALSAFFLQVAHNIEDQHGSEATQAWSVGFEKEQAEIVTHTVPISDGIGNLEDLMSYNSDAEIRSADSMGDFRVGGTD